MVDCRGQAIASSPTGRASSSNSGRGDPSTGECVRRELAPGVDSISTERSARARDRCSKASSSRGSSSSTSTSSPRGARRSVSTRARLHIQVLRALVARLAADPAERSVPHCASTRPHRPARRRPCARQSDPISCRRAGRPNEAQGPVRECGSRTLEASSATKPTGPLETAWRELNRGGGPEPSGPPEATHAHTPAPPPCGVAKRAASARNRIARSSSADATRNVERLLGDAWTSAAGGATAGRIHAQGRVRRRKDAAARRAAPTRHVSRGCLQCFAASRVRGRRLDARTDRGSMPCGNSLERPSRGPAVPASLRFCPSSVLHPNQRRVAIDSSAQSSNWWPRARAQALQRCCCSTTSTGVTMHPRSCSTTSRG